MKLVHAVGACLAGAGLAVYGATRVWSVEVTPRPGLSDLRAPATGADAQPWLIALALIGLAGAGALLATRGTARRGLGVLLMIVGAGVALAAIIGRAGTDAGAAGAGAAVWPIACVLGGALIVLAGLGAARRGHTWPVMGARYERRPVPSSADGVAAGSGPSPAAGPGGAPERGPAVGSGGAPAVGPVAGSGGAPERGPAVGSGGAPAVGPAAGSGGAPAPGPANDAADGAGAIAATGPEPGARVERTVAPVDTRAVWDALDRGDDPTAR
jgi:hypothetical protein